MTRDWGDKSRQEMAVRTTMKPSCGRYWMDKELIAGVSSRMVCASLVRNSSS